MSKSKYQINLKIQSSRLFWNLSFGLWACEAALALALFVFWIFFANYVNHFVSFDYLAVFANFFNRCSYFHCNNL